MPTLDDIHLQLSKLKELQTYLSSTVSTANIKVNLGAEWWCDMSRDQAEAFVMRRHTYLLRLLAKSVLGQGYALPATEEDVHSMTPTPQKDFIPPVPTKSTLIEEPAASPQPSIELSSATSLSPTNPISLPLLNGIIDQALQHSGVDGSAPGVEVHDDGTVFNEEGLPFLDIREDLPPTAPISSSSSSTTVPSGSTVFVADGPGEEEEEGEDYWSDAAVARRAALRKRLFGDEEEEDDAFFDEGMEVSEDEVDDEEGEEGEKDEDEDEDEDEVNPPKGTSRPSEPQLPPPTAPEVPSRAPIPGKLIRSTVISSPSTSSPLSQPSVTVEDAPKSILKPVRKKSVTFADELEEDLEPVVPLKTVEVATKPTATMSGLKRGFLNTPKPTTSAKSPLSHPPKVAPPPVVQSSAVPTIPTFQLNSEDLPLPETVTPPTVREKGKGKSLFAQRKAQGKGTEIDAPGASPVKSGEAGGLGSKAAMSDTVVERAPVVPTPMVAPPTKRLVQSTVFKGGVVEKAPPAVKVEPPTVVPAIRITPGTPLPSASFPSNGDNDDEDGLAEEYEDNDPSAFDMDDAMLAREAALAYHAGRAALGRAALGEEADEWEQEEVPLDAGGYVKDRSRAVGFNERVFGKGGEGGVADFVRRSVRMGKLENGNLVVEDGEDSDDEEDPEEHGRKRDIMDMLRQGKVGELLERERKEEGERKMVEKPVEPKSDILPEVGVAKPMVVNDAAESEVVATKPVQKVSRFKAARMAGRG